jgi:CrcB protein
MRMLDSHHELPLDPDPAELGAPPRPLHTEPSLLAAVAVGGLLGTCSRYGIARALPAAGHGWPLATFLVNVAGALLLGLLLEVLARRGPDEGRRRVVRLLLGTGFLGAFTTWSTLAVETDLLVRDGRVGLAAAYVLASAAAGAMAVAAGIALGVRAR